MFETTPVGYVGGEVECLERNGPRVSGIEFQVSSIGTVWMIACIYPPNYDDLTRLHIKRQFYMGDCQNYSPYYNTGPNLGDPKRDHNLDNPPYTGSLGSPCKASPSPQQFICGSCPQLCLR